jgi:hypothetical protein
MNEHRIDYEMKRERAKEKRKKEHSSIMISLSLEEKKNKKKRIIIIVHQKLENYSIRKKRIKTNKSISLSNAMTLSHELHLHA